MLTVTPRVAPDFTLRKSAGITEDPGIVIMTSRRVADRVGTVALKDVLFVPAALQIVQPHRPAPGTKRSRHGHGREVVVSAWISDNHDDDNDDDDEEEEEEEEEEVRRIRMRTILKTIIMM